ERERDPVKRAAWLTFVVVGGGATGVELAGTFAEIARHTLRGEFRRIDPHTARVVLVEGASRVLPPYPPELSAKAQLALERLGVVPGIAPAAKQMGRHAGRNVERLIQGRPTVKFTYRDYGQLATIGRNAAVATIGRLRLSGFAAWLVWLVAHIYFLINFRNRLVVMIDWAWAYWSYQRYARIIIRGAKSR